MSEKAHERKVVSRNVVILLEFFCILLTGGLLVAEADILNYRSIVRQKDETIATMDSQLWDKDAIINSMNYTMRERIETLESPQVHVVNFNWTDNHPINLPPFVHVTWTIFNSGTENATTVYAVFRLFYSNNTMFGRYQLLLGAIAGKSYQNYERNLEYYIGMADHVTLAVDVSYIYY